MREHQIVITLKPEQFLEVQRMARAAGAKSMGNFVRQMLLSALGMGGAAPKLNKDKSISENDIEEFQKLSSELVRLHGELKAFVTESLGENFAVEVDIESAQNTSVGKLDIQTDENPEIQAGDPVSIDPVSIDPVSMPGAMSNPAFGLTKPPSPYYQSNAPNILHDPLEQYAQRAFAASPILGPISSVSGKDPLDELLEEPDKLHGDIAENEQDEEEMISVPISLTGKTKTKPEQSALWKPDQQEREEHQIAEANQKKIDDQEPPASSDPSPTSTPVDPPVNNPPPRKRQRSDN